MLGCFFISLGFIRIYWNILGVLSVTFFWFCLQLNVSFFFFITSLTLPLCSSSSLFPLLLCRSFRSFDSINNFGALWEDSCTLLHILYSSNFPSPSVVDKISSSICFMLLANWVRGIISHHAHVAVRFGFQFSANFHINNNLKDAIICIFWLLKNDQRRLTYCGLSVANYMFCRHPFLFILIFAAGFISIFLGIAFSLCVTKCPLVFVIGKCSV